MNIKDKIDDAYSTFTNSDLLIYEYIKNDYSRLINGGTIVDFARSCGVSKSAVSRFAQKLGLSGFPELRFEISRFAHSGIEAKDESQTKISLITDAYSRAVADLVDFVSEDNIRSVVSAMMQAEKVKIYGFDRSGFTARHFRYRLDSIEFDAEAVTDSFLMSSIASKASENDVHIFFSVDASSSPATAALKNAFEKKAAPIPVS